jgi:hypothetical protein
MREFHARCVKISRIPGGMGNFFYDLQGFFQKRSLALAVLKNVLIHVDGFAPFDILGHRHPNNKNNN